MLRRQRPAACRSPEPLESTMEWIAFWKVREKSDPPSHWRQVIQVCDDELMARQQFENLESSSTHEIRDAGVARVIAFDPRP